MGKGLLELETDPIVAKGGAADDRSEVILGTPSRVKVRSRCRDFVHRITLASTIGFKILLSRYSISIY